VLNPPHRILTSFFGQACARTGKPVGWLENTAYPNEHRILQSAEVVQVETSDPQT